jgi:hypothetical protein
LAAIFRRDHRVFSLFQLELQYLPRNVLVVGNQNVHGSRFPRTRLAENSKSRNHSLQNLFRGKLWTKLTMRFRSLFALSRFW